MNDLVSTDAPKPIVIDGRVCKRCRHCGQPMKPKGIKKNPNEYDHAQGCPYAIRAKGGNS